MAAEIVHRLEETQVEDLLALYGREWWTQGRHIDDVRRMLAGSSAIVGCVETDSRRLIGFARALTDGVYKALVLDVIVAAAQRSTGLGRRVVAALLAHPRLRHVRHFELYCRPDMVPFYAQWGFTDALDDLRFMRLDTTAPTPVEP